MTSKIFEELQKEFSYENRDDFLKNLQICIFCVFNMNEKLFPPYIDVNKLQYLVNNNKLF